jgi:hypothetical protein
MRLVALWLALAPPSLGRKSNERTCRHGETTFWPPTTPWACNKVFGDGFDPSPYALLPRNAAKPRRLRGCRALFPAGTGTLSLFETLARSSAGGRGDVSHLHERRSSASAPCHVMTLRDPAHRLESAWRFHSNPYRAEDIDDFFTPVRCGEDDRRKFEEPYRNAVCATRHCRRRGDWTIFFLSQVDYLRDFDAGRSELFVVCQESVEADVRALGAAFGEPLEPRHANNRSRVKHPEGKGNSTLSAANAAFVREQLYPWDAALHGALCGDLHGLTREAAAARGEPPPPSPRGTCAGKLPKPKGGK